MNKYYGKNAPILSEIVADREEWLELLGSDVSDETLRHLGITRHTWRRIHQGKEPRVPMAAYRLAQFKRHGHLADMLGKSWAEFYVSGNTLALPGVKQPLQAHELRGIWFQLQELPHLRHQITRLQAESDYVEVSPAVGRWLTRMGKRPLAQS